MYVGCVYYGMEFIELPAFTRCIANFAADEELHVLQKELLGQPDKGDLVRGTGGARKIRLAVKSKGKRGGARVIYYCQDKNGIIWFLYACYKNEKKDLSAQEKKAIAYIVKEIKEGRYEE